MWIAISRAQSLRIYFFSGLGKVDSGQVHPQNTAFFSGQPIFFGWEVFPFFFSYQ